MAVPPKLSVLLLTLSLLILSTASASSSSSYLHLDAADDTCKETYGFLPCSTSWKGNLFLIFVYGYFMYMGASILLSGSELLHEILGPGIIGGSLLPILSALPGAVLIIVSGLSGSAETAQSQVSAGMGLLAGTTVMLLTVIWGSCVVAGKCDLRLQNLAALDKVDTVGYCLTGSGVSTDIWTAYDARTMVISVLPFIIVQVSQLLYSTPGRHLAVLTALLISVALLVSYCLCQVFQPWIQRRKLAYIKHKHIIFEFLRQLHRHTLGRLMTDDGEVNIEVVTKIFETIDENGDGYLSHSELKAFILGICFEDIDLDENVAVNKIMRDFDTSVAGQLDEGNFVDGITRWLNRAAGVGAHAGRRNFGTMKFLDDFHHETKWENAQLLIGDQSEEAGEVIGNAKLATLKAVLLVVLGTIIAAVLSDPLVVAVENFSDATSIPTFFVSFIVLPLATNSREAISAIKFASHKKQRTASLTFSELYSAVTMNNMLSLSVFLAVVYVRGLTWDFSVEVLVVLLVCIPMGAFASFRTSFPLWTSMIAFLLYPFSLALVYVY